MEKCAAWLRELMQVGMSECEGVKTKAKELGFTLTQLKAARKILGVKTWHQFDPDAGIENWFWYLPEEQA